VRTLKPATFLENFMPLLKEINRYGFYRRVADDKNRIGLSAGEKRGLTER
jgi:hypothetical protein